MKKNINLFVQLELNSPAFGGGWGEEKQPKILPPAPSKGGDSTRSIFTPKFESHIYLIIN